LALSIGRDRLAAVAAGLGAAAIWGGMYAVSKVVLAVIPPFTLLSLRLALGALALGAVWLRNPGPPASVRLVAAVAAIGALGFGVSLGLQFVGTSLSNASNAALVTSASPAFMIVFAAWLLREKATFRRLGALALASLGVVVVIDPGGGQLASGAFAGNLTLLGAALSWALFSVLVKWATRRMSVLAVSFWGVVGGLLVAVPAALLERQAAPIGPIGLPVAAGVLYLGLISTALAALLWNRALEALKAGTVSILFFAQPIVGAGLGALWLGEHLAGTFWLGGALVAVGVLLVGREPAEAPLRQIPA
jgi:drug/metabolite transporter (DMT)-like permease